MTWKLETDYGTLELPRFSCLICFSQFRFTACNMCPVVLHIERKAHDEWTRIWDEEQEKKKKEIKE